MIFIPRDGAWYPFIIKPYISVGLKPHTMVFYPFGVVCMAQYFNKKRKGKQALILLLLL